MLSWLTYLCSKRMIRPQPQPKSRTRRPSKLCPVNCTYPSIREATNAVDCAIKVAPCDPVQLSCTSSDGMEGKNAFMLRYSDGISSSSLPHTSSDKGLNSRGMSVGEVDGSFASIEARIARSNVFMIHS